MYRVLLTRGKKAYAIECDSEFYEDSDNYDNLFDENIHGFVNEGDVIVVLDDIDDFKTYLPNYEVEIVEREE